MQSGDLDWLEESLEQEEDVIVPLRQMWSRKFARTETPPFDEFARSVLGDERFEQVYSIHFDIWQEGPGLIEGPRIKLRSREITQHNVLRLLEKNNERLIRALQTLLEALREQTGEATVRQLSEALLMIDGLRPAFRPWSHLGSRDSKH